MLFYWFLAQLLSGFGSLAYMDQSMGGVAYFAHIGGFITGVGTVYPFKDKLKKSYA
jgi:membrane associated rhomboid family serine protease